MTKSTATQPQATPPTPINLLKGAPNPHLLPADILRHAATRVLSDPSTYADALAYGPDAGYEPLRESIAGWLSSFYHPAASAIPGPSASAISSKRICITGGASQNLGITLTLYTDPRYTRAVFLVAPAYFLSFRIFTDAGFTDRLRAVREDDEGVDIAALRQNLEDEETKWKDDGSRDLEWEGRRTKVYKYVIYCVPSFSNPSGGTMSLRRRRELVKLARQFDALLVADDVYDFLQWDVPSSVGVQTGSDLKAEPVHDLARRAQLPRLVDIDRELDAGPERKGADGWGNACSNGSFSKIAGPGIRVGWVEGTEKFAYGISQAGTTCSGGAPSQLTSTYVHQMLRYRSLEGEGEEAGDSADGSLQHFIRETLLPAHASRSAQLMNAIEKHLVPLGFNLPRRNRSFMGGYFTWLSLPEGLDADALARRCREEENVAIAPGSIFEVPGDERVKFPSNVRLCWAWEDEHQLSEGVERVAGVARRTLEEGDGGEYVVVETGGQGVADFK